MVVSRVTWSPWEESDLCAGQPLTARISSQSKSTALDKTLREWKRTILISSNSKENEKEHRYFGIRKRKNWGQSGKGRWRKEKSLSWQVLHRKTEGSILAGTSQWHHVMKSTHGQRLLTSDIQSPLPPESQQCPVSGLLFIPRSQKANK